MCPATDETREQRFAAVARIVKAAREVVCDRSIADALPSSTGLSSQGVALALSACLETNPPDEEIHALVDAAKRTGHVHVILSANVFTAALRAIACARAAAPTVSVQLSSREPIFAARLIRAIADPAVFVADRDAIQHLAGGEVHVYGRAETIEDVRRRVSAGVVVRAHGPGMGIAVVAEKDSIIDAANGIARDVVPFDQRGCLSPRVVFVVGEVSRAESFAEQLAAALARLGEEIPRGALTTEESGESARFLETMRFVGSARVGHDSVVGLSPTCIVPPTGRHVHITCISGIHRLTEVTQPFARYVTAVGATDAAIDGFFSHRVRISDFGKMQRPPFDGPVDLRCGDLAR